MESVGIVGSGINGLVIAYNLAKKGYRVTVLEKGKSVGGLSGFFELDGVYLEKFYHHFFASDIHAIKLVEELGLSKKLKFYNSSTGLFFKDKTYSLDSVSDVLSLPIIPFFQRLRLGFFFFFVKYLVPLNSLLDNVSAVDWLKIWLGNSTYYKMWDRLLRGKFGKDFGRISANWFCARIKDRTKKLGYIDGSNRELFKTLVEAIKKRGGRIRKGVGVQSIESQKSKVCLTIVGGKKYFFDNVIVTTIYPVIATLVRNPLGAQLDKIAGNLDHMGVVCVLLTLRQKVQNFYWLNIADKDSPALVLVEHTNMIDNRRYGSKAIVYLASYQHRDSREFNLSDEEVLKKYVKTLFKINNKFDNSWIIDAKVFRAPVAQTVFKINKYQKPPFKIPNTKIAVANIDHMYPHDRSLNQSIKLAEEISRLFP